MAKRVSVVEFRIEAPERVVEEMDRLGRAHDGWVNMSPAVDSEEEPESPSGLSMLFSIRVHPVPVCTWVPGKLQRHGLDPDSLGVQHSAGTRTLALLRSLGVEVPVEWRALQDHPRRGLVLVAPNGTDHAEELNWLLRAGTLLSKVEVHGDWIAEVHSKE